MKQYSEQEITEIRVAINNGVQYCGIKNGYGFGVIYIISCEYIGWRHAGESANENTNEGLRFILEEIFNDCDEVVPCKWSSYHINYIPIDEKYKGVDCSRSHPNVCGL